MHGAESDVPDVRASSGRGAPHHPPGLSHYRPGASDTDPIQRVIDERQVLARSLDRVGVPHRPRRVDQAPHSRSWITCGTGTRIAGNLDDVPKGTVVGNPRHVDSVYTATYELITTQCALGSKLRIETAVQNQMKPEWKPLVKAVDTSNDLDVVTGVLFLVQNCLLQNTTNPSSHHHASWSVLDTLERKLMQYGDQLSTELRLTDHDPNDANHHGLRLRHEHWIKGGGRCDHDKNLPFVAGEEPSYFAEPKFTEFLQWMQPDIMLFPRGWHGVHEGPYVSVHHLCRTLQKQLNLAKKATTEAPRAVSPPILRTKDLYGVQPEHIDLYVMCACTQWVGPEFSHQYFNEGHWTESMAQLLSDDQGSTQRALTVRRSRP